jgi:DNA ligase-1
MDAVLIAAEPGHGRRAGLLTDYTFGVWDGGALVPIAKAYSGLTNAEIAEMDRFVRAHTVTRHGPVHTVEPLRVFEIAFEAIQVSTRHKSGLAVRFPRILRRRTDKMPAQADMLSTVRELLNHVEAAR